MNNQLFADDTTDLLDEERAGIFRSLVGALLYVSHDRGDIQFAAKSLATDLSNPTTFFWAMLGRLVGYLKKHEKVSMVLTKTRPHNSLFGKLGGAEPDDDSVLLESFSCHYVSGNLIYSSSRSQKAISLSSTESEWYAAISTSIDSLHLKHILQFLFDQDCKVVLRVDNSAVISISAKLGTARLKHIEGKLLWLQSKVSSKQLELRSVGTSFNVADVGTKGLNRVRHLVMIFLLGMQEDDVMLGEKEYEELCCQDFMKKQQKKTIYRAGMKPSLTAAIWMAMAQVADSMPVEQPLFVKALSFGWRSLLVLFVLCVFYLLLVATYISYAEKT